MKPHALLAVVFVSAWVVAACSGGPEPVSPSSATPAAPPTPTGKSISTTQVARGLASPWSMAFLPDGRLLVTERAGNLRLVSTDGTLSAPLAGVPAVEMTGQGGLLGLALGPDFANDSRVFLAYTESAGSGLNRTAVASGRLTDSALTDVQVIFRQQPAVAGGLHFGSRLAFDRSNNLFVTLGERNLKDPAQALDNHLGKVIRLRADGSVPADNPFVGQAGALPEIYSYGHRNPQGLSIHPQTGEPWISEHGPQGGDEINRVLPGRNYGWPRITHGVNYGSGTPIGEGTTAADVEPSLFFWVPVSVAPSGMIFQVGNTVPALQGSVLVGALAGQALIQLPWQDDAITGNEKRWLDTAGERIRDVVGGPDGHPYLLTDSGRILRVDPQ